MIIFDLTLLDFDFFVDQDLSFNLALFLEQLVVKNSSFFELPLVYLVVLLKKGDLLGKDLFLSLLVCHLGLHLIEFLQKSQILLQLQLIIVVELVKLFNDLLLGIIGDFDETVTDCPLQFMQVFLNGFTLADSS